MNVDKQYITHLATVDAVAYLVGALVYSLDNPEAGNVAAPRDLAHKVATSINKNLSKHLSVGDK